MLLVSYLRTWPLGSTEEEMAQDRHWRAGEIRGELLDTVNLAFGLLSGNRIYIPHLAGESGGRHLFTEVAALQGRHPHLKVNLSVGGWGAEGFSAMALTPENRAAFTADALNWLEGHDLDGIDIDWEYPVGREEGENYILLLADLRQGLNRLMERLSRPLTLSTAVPAASWFPRAIDLDRVQQQVDYLKLMAYDFYGGWSPTTGQTANLYRNPQDPADWSVDQAVQLYLAAGVRPDKLLLGVPFYARAWRGVAPENGGLYQPYTSSAYEHGLSYTELQRFLADPSYKRFWDDTAKAAYLYNGQELISYEDPQSLAHKAAYVREKGLGGIMIWEYGHDLSGQLLEALHAALKGNVSNPENT